MPRYRVLTRSYIAGDIREPDEIVTYRGKPGSNLELIGTPGPRRRKTEAMAPPDQEEKPQESTE